MVCIGINPDCLACEAFTLVFKKLKFLYGLLLRSFFFCALFAVSFAHGEELVIETIPIATAVWPASSPSEGVGLESDAVVDGDGNVHIAYRDGGQSDGTLYYANNTRGLWKAIRINRLVEPTGPDFVAEADRLAMALDSSDTPYIAHAWVNAMSITTIVSGNWVSERIENEPTAEDTEVSLIIDEHNTIHAVYFLFNGDLRYAKRTNGTWNVTTVAETGEDFATGSDHTNSLVLDESGNAHIGFIGRDALLYYASNQSGVWESTLLASPAKGPEVNQQRVWLDKDYVVLPGGIYHLLVHNHACMGGLLGCLCIGMEYRSNQSGDEEPETVAQLLYEESSRIQSYPIASPSIAVDPVSGDVSTSFALIVYPKPRRKTPKIFYIFNAQKSDSGWEITPAEPSGFETSSSRYNSFTEMRFNSTTLSPDGSPVTTFFNGTLDSLQIKHVLKEEVSLGLDILLIKAASGNKK